MCEAWRGPTREEREAEEFNAETARIQEQYRREHEAEVFEAGRRQGLREAQEQGE